MRTNPKSALLLVLLAALAACNEKKPQPTPVAAGLTATTNDARVVTLARAALECTWTDDKGLDEKCPALEAWQGAAEVRASSADATLLELTRDPRPAVRWLGATALAGTEEKESTRELLRNPEQAKALIEVARRETNPRVGRELGFAVAEIHLAPIEREPTIRELANTHPLPLLRAALVSRVLRHNPESFVWVATMARTEGHATVRHAAIGALRFAPPERFGTTALLWLELARDKNADLAEKAASCCAFYEAICATEWDALLDAMEARGGMPSALWNLFSRPKATSAQKARAQRLVRAALENTSQEDTTRSLALLVLADMDPAIGVALATKYQTDADVALTTSAEIVLKEHGDAGAPAAGKPDASAPRR